MSFVSNDPQVRVTPKRRSARLLVRKRGSDFGIALSTSKPLPNASPKASTLDSPAPAAEDTGSERLSPTTTSNRSDAGLKPKESRSKALSDKDDIVVGKTANSKEDMKDFILKLVTEKDRHHWKGWCEVESEPAFFNVMLREFGVEGIKVQEVLSLDEDHLIHLPKPVYGLIFLFEFRDDDSARQEATCPDYIWFANQTTSNACASIALLNIIMNVPDIELGPTLQSLKNFTATMNPALCGYQVCNHDYIRQIHNSFARKLDMLNADLALSNDVYTKRQRKRTGSKSRLEAEQAQAGFHFIAFVPIGGNVWKLDGLERQPMNLGAFTRDWMEIARPMIEERMQKYEGDQIQFNLLSLCKSPLLSIPIQLAANIRSLTMIEKHLDRIQPDWHSFIGDDECDTILRGPSVIYKVSQKQLDEAIVPQQMVDTTEELLYVRRRILNQQNNLRTAMIEESTAVDQDDDKTRRRRHDYTPLIHAWITFLAENATLQDLVETEGRV